MSSPFSIAILNGTSSLRAPILFCGYVPAIKKETKLNIAAKGNGRRVLLLNPEIKLCASPRSSGRDFKLTVC